MMNKNLLNEQFAFSNQNHIYQIENLIHQIKKDTDYLEELEVAFSTEIDFRNKRKKMLQENFITQDEVYKSETTFYKICNDYTTIFWDIIKNKLLVIDLCSNNFPLLTTFIGETNEL